MLVQSWKRTPGEARSGFDHGGQVIISRAPPWSSPDWPGWEASSVSPLRRSLPCAGAGLRKGFGRAFLGDSARDLRRRSPRSSLTGRRRCPALLAEFLGWGGRVGSRHACRHPRTRDESVVTDMGATERLLAVTAEQVDLAGKLIADLRLVNVPGSPEDLAVLKVGDALNEAIEAIVELRRRGDTLVRAEDLLAVLDAAVGGKLGAHQNGWPHGAAARLEDALGGMR